VSSDSDASAKVKAWDRFKALSTADCFLFLFGFAGFLLSTAEFLRFLRRALFFALWPALSTTRQQQHQVPPVSPTGRLDPAAQDTPICEARTMCKGPLAVMDVAPTCNTGH